MDTFSIQCVRTLKLVSLSLVLPLISLLHDSWCNYLRTRLSSGQFLSTGLAFSLTWAYHCLPSIPSVAHPWLLISLGQTLETSLLEYMHTRAHSHMYTWLKLRCRMGVFHVRRWHIWSPPCSSVCRFCHVMFPVIVQSVFMVHIKLRGTEELDQSYTDRKWQHQDSHPCMSPKATPSRVPQGLSRS